MRNQVILKPTRLPPTPPRQKKKNGGLWKGALVVLFSTILTTIAINASDIFHDPKGSLLAGVANSGTKPHCPSDMVYVAGEHSYCVDRYEVSAGTKCPYQSPTNQFETEANLSDPLCLSTAAEAKKPWVNIALHDALRACAKVSKRLPTNREWYRAAIGTPDLVNPDDNSACALGKLGKSDADKTGSHSNCQSSLGAFDMVGNVWEWVDGEVDNGLYEKRELPSEGYVDEVDTAGVPTKVSTSSDPAFGEDYLFIDKSGVRGMIRGGFWALKEKAGIYDINASIATSFIGSAVGFRCATDAL